MNSVDVVYVEAGGDVVGSLDCWARGERVASETSITFSGQFYDYCESRRLSALALSFGIKSSERNFEGIRAKNVKRIKLSGRGSYHAVMLANALVIFWYVFSLRPKFLVVNSGVTHWFMLSVCKFVGVSIIPSLHSTYVSVDEERAEKGGLKGAITMLDGVFFRNLVRSIICVSSRCERQLLHVFGNLSARFFIHTPQFEEEDFLSVESPDCLSEVMQHDRFEIMFAGRIEENKGVLDLPIIASKLVKKGFSHFRFTVCGDGGALNNLQALIVELGVGSYFSLTGRLARGQLIKVYANSDLVVVPTRSNCAEGFAMVAAEAILNGKPALCSSAVPAAEVLGEAAIVVPANSVDSYVDRIVELISKEDVYSRLVEICREKRRVFFDRNFGFSAALNSASSP